MKLQPIRERYINPYTDFGFKKLFGSAMNKDLLISFLNALLEGEQKIEHITYLNNEHVGARKDNRRAIFDVYCENDKGEKFIVEMQNVFQHFFKDRSVYYATFPIQEQAIQGIWEFELTAVYTVGILNFVFDEDRNSPECYHHHVMLMDVKRKEVFYDKLHFIYLEMPKFEKTENELETMFDKWMFVLRNLSRLMERPAALQERVFEKLFQAAEIAKFKPSEYAAYQDSMKAFRDIDNGVKTAKEEGRVEGREEGKVQERIELARKMKQKGYAVAEIREITGLSQEEIERLV
jgi:predicted transposase/invertase (TIGR01784 family)